MFRKKLSVDDAVKEAWPQRDAFLGTSDATVSMRIIDEWDGIYRQLRTSDGPSFLLWCSALMVDNQAKRYATATGEDVDLTRVKILALISQFPMNRSGDPMKYLSLLPPRVAWDLVTKLTDSLVEATLTERDH